MRARHAASVLCCLALTAAVPAATGRQALSISPDWTVAESSPQAGFGGLVSGVGDVNGDGFADVLVGAYNRRVSLYTGSSSGLASTHDWTWEGEYPLARLDQAAALGDLNGDGFGDVIVGASTWGQFGDSSISWVFLGSSTGLSTTPAWIGGGRSVAGVGDVNGDGFDDVMIGNPAASLHQFDTYEGAASLFLGSSSPNGIPDQKFKGSLDGGYFGHVAAAGDVDGDGFDDVLIGAPGIRAGVVYLYRGARSGLKPNATELAIPGIGSEQGPAGDINGDGYDDFFLRSGQSTYQKIHIYLGRPDLRALAPSFVLQPDPPSANVSFASAGDVNDDGFGDVILGVPDQNRSFVYFGSASGLDATPLILEGLSGEGFGRSVSTARDVNGDGFDDIIIGAPQYAPGGRALVYHGGP
jgi:hypothetical protein